MQAEQDKQAGRGAQTSRDVQASRASQVPQMGVRAVYLGKDAEGTEAAAAAEELAARLSVLITRDESTACEAGLHLRADARGLALADGGLELLPDLTRMMPRLAHGKLAHELLVKAARLRGVEAPTAIDATAGLGEDALLLSAAGFEVWLYESDPVIAALLADALRRAAQVPELAGLVARMHAQEGDSTAALGTLDVSEKGGVSEKRGVSEKGGAAAMVSPGKDLPSQPDVVYLDPMFPERRKSAAVKKKFQLLHGLERPCDDAGTLLAAARAARPRKIVIKRPVKGPNLAGVKPSYSVAGKAVRYDCLVLPR